MTSLMKRIFSILITAMLITSVANTTVFAAEHPQGTTPQASYASEGNTTRAYAPGPLVASNTAKFYYSGEVTLTVPSGQTAKYVGIIIADRTTGKAATGSFYVSPAFPNVSVFQSSSGVQFFTLAGNGIIGERTVTYTFTVKDADYTHLYEVGVLLYG